MVFIDYQLLTIFKNKALALTDAKKTDLLQQYTILNLGIGFVVPPLVYFISQFYPELFYNRGVIWISFMLAIFVIIWMLLNVAKASNSKHIRLPGLILWGIASPLCSIFLFAAVYFGATSQHNLSFVHAL